MHKVLLVDDSKLCRLVTMRMIDRHDVAVIVAADGVEALARMTDDHFDAVLMDCQMPRLDGFGATRAIREREAQTGADPTPIIGVSVRDMTGDRQAAFAAGMDDYLVKPVQAEDLRAVLNRWIGPPADDVDADPDAARRLTLVAAHV